MKTKEKVLLLLQRSEYISGQEIANRLSLSRNAVWKAIASLCEEGYEISSVKGKGYCLISDKDLLSQAVISSLLLNEAHEYAVTVLDIVASTNNELKSRAQSGADKEVIIANCQTSGKGRYGRSFQSLRGNGLYMSILCRARIPADKAVLITSMAAVSVMRAVEMLYGIKPGIKWVNDLFVDGKKIAGILTEGGVVMESGMLDYAVVGIGINTGLTPLGEQLSDIAGTLGLYNKSGATRNELAARIIGEFARLLPLLPDTSYMDEYISASILNGEKITATAGNTSFEATVIGIERDATLRVKKENGEVVSLSSGEVTLHKNSHT